MDSKDQPLRAEVKDGLLVISIGVDTLAFADKERIQADYKFKIINPAGFAEDVVREMAHENEIGASPLTDFLDDMMREAKDSGSAHVDHLP